MIWRKEGKPEINQVELYPRDCFVVTHGVTPRNDGGDKLIPFTT
jgi:hypothetical protein